MSNKEYKQEQIEIWNSLAGEYDQSFSALMYPAAQQMIEAAGLREGDHVLDVASGTGIDAFMAAPYVGNTGRIVGIDISPRMVDLGNEKAAARGRPNVTFQVMDAERLEFKESLFDAAISKWGLTFFPDTHRALKEVLRVLKPGGRFVTMVFGRPEGTQFLTVAARAAAKHLMSAVVSNSGGPTDFQFGADGALEAAFNAAGFVKVHARRFAVMITCKTSQIYWDLLIAGTGRLSYHLTRATAQVREAIINEVRTSVERYQTGEGIRLPIEVVIGYGEKARKERDRAPNLPRRSIVELVDDEAQRVQQISVSDAAELVRAQRCVVLDVRSRSAFADGHVPGAVSVPRGRLEAVVGNLVRDANVKLVVVGDGAATIFAAKTLADLGYTDVAALHGGFSAWQAANQPVTT